MCTANKLVSKESVLSLARRLHQGAGEETKAAGSPPQTYTVHHTPPLRRKVGGCLIAEGLGRGHSPAYSLSGPWWTLMD